MRALSAAQVVGVWERGLDQHPIDRALTMLEAGSGQPRDRLAALTIGRRDASLLELHNLTFGGALNAFTQCPQCAERLEYSVSVAQLQLGSPRQADEAGPAIVAAGRRFQLRPLDSRDLAAVAAAADAASARLILARRCLGLNYSAESLHDHAPAEIAPPEDPLLEDSAAEDPLSEEFLAQVAEQIAKADPLSEVLMSLQCAACGCQWQEVFDIESFLWAKVSASAKRLLREVHTLARAYCWPEGKILGLTAARRRFYLEMVS